MKTNLERFNFLTESENRHTTEIAFYFFHSYKDIHSKFFFPLKKSESDPLQYVSFVFRINSRKDFEALEKNERVKASWFFLG